MKRLFLLSFVMVLLASNIGAMAQAPAPAADAAVPSVVAQVDSYGEALGAVVTVLATLFGLPIVSLTYRKTRAEIANLELEANALREKQGAQSERSRDAEGNADEPA